MLSKFFQSFNEKKDNNEAILLTQVYTILFMKLLLQIIKLEQEINLVKLVEYYFKIPASTNTEQFNKLADQKHFNTDLSQFSRRLKTALSYEQRMDIILICWQVLTVDDNEDKLEVSTARKISTLLVLKIKILY